MKNNFTLNKGFNPEGQAKLIVKGFGLNALKAKFYNANSDTNTLTLQELAQAEGTDGQYSGMFGLPVFDIITFGDTNGLRYKTLNGEIISIGRLDLGTVLCTVNMTKNIVATPIQGRNGTVKEYISDGDYVINIKGLIVSPAQESFPEVEFNVLKKYCDAPVEIPVASTFLNRFGIKSFVIQDYRFDQTEGMRNVQAFEINCLSDQPIELKSQSLS